MNVHLSLVKPAGRKWQEWLDWPTEIPERSPDSFLATKHYQKPGRYLVLVHGAGQASQKADRELYDASAFAEYRGRVWILYYSGSGYPGQTRSVFSEHLHCLGYPIANQLGAAQTKCFRNAIAMLADQAEIRPDALWQTLYPPDNVRAVTLLLLLTASRRLNVDSAVDRLLGEAGSPESDLSRAYSEYCSASTLFSGAAPWSYQAVREHLELRTYKDLSEEFGRILGRVPD
jgi:hypothetical protein